MTKPFYERLEKYFSDVSSVLRGASNKSAIFPNPSDIGESREDLFAKILSDHLPVNCNVRKGGFLFGIDGRESNQIDIIINSSNSLQFNFMGDNSKTFSCVDGCIGVVSVKSNLTKGNLIEAINNIASIPIKSDTSTNKNPFIDIKNFTDWPCKIIFAPKGASYDLILDTLNTYCDGKKIPENFRPNYVYVVGSYLIQSTGCRERKTRDGTILPPYTYTAIFDTKIVDKLAIPTIVTELQDTAMAASQIIYRYSDIVDKMC